MPVTHVLKSGDNFSSLYLQLESLDRSPLTRRRLNSASRLTKSKTVESSNPSSNSSLASLNVLEKYVRVILSL